MRVARWFLALLATAPLFAAEVDLVRVWPRYREAASFIGIGEYFGRPETDGRRTIARSQPGERGGFYWLIRTRATAAVPDATVALSVIRPDAPAPREHTFPIALPAGSHAVLVGLTGADWPDAAERPVAWRIRLLDAAGTELAAEQSFLWTLPEPRDPAAADR